MKRRAMVAALAGGAALTACSKPESKAGASATSGKTYKWTMVTTWPKDFPGVGMGANRLAQRIFEMSGGRLQIKVAAAGELVPALQVFDAVQTGMAEMGHGASYYWKGKLPIAPVFSAIPFGMTAQEINAWLYYGGGLELYRELYKPFGLIPAPAGNTGCQMAGWFRKEINSLADIKALKMRIPGLGGEVLAKAGGEPVLVAGGEIFTSLQTGAIDAAEWVGPFNDLAMGLYKVAPYYYYPAWHEPGTSLEVMINDKAMNELPEDLRAIVLAACQAANMDMLSEFTARNHEALNTLVKEHGTQVRKLPDEVLLTFRNIADEVMQATAKTDAISQQIFDSCVKFRGAVQGWHEISERAFMQARALP